MSKEESIQKALEMVRALNLQEHISEADLRKAADQLEASRASATKEAKAELFDLLDSTALEAADAALNCKVLDQMLPNNQRTTPVDAGDWNAVHRLMCMATDMALGQTMKIGRLLKDAKRQAVSGQDVATLATEMSIFNGLRCLLTQHAILVLKHNVLETRNADIHYDRVRGMVEQALSRSRSKNNEV